MSRFPFAMVLLASLLVALTGCGDKGKDGTAKDGKPAGDDAYLKGKTEIAFVVNVPARFWSIAEAGVLAASKEFKIKTEFFIPQNLQEGQKQILEDLMTRGIKGVAITPIDPDNQQALLNKVAANSFLITHDSDAPKSNRRYYVGVDNYSAGREAGKLVKEALPEGGTVMIFVGNLGQMNARQRRQGVIDELMDRPQQDVNTAVFDPNSGEIKNAKYTILDTRTDDADTAKVAQQPQDALTKYPDLGCMVGLFEYNPPAILNAVKGANRLGKTKIVGFDEADDTLSGITEGHIQGTIAQQPYGYGYESVKILAGLIRDDKKLLPDKNVIYLPPIVVKKDGPDKPTATAGSNGLTVNAKAYRADVTAKLKARDDAKK